MFLIYVGRCLPTNKVYVGSTGQGKRRVLSHIRDLNCNRHSNAYLQRAWDKHGEDNFIWHVVEECGTETLRTREQWWIGFLRANDRRYGYNLCNPVSDDVNIKSVLAQTQVKLWQDPEIRNKRLVGLRNLHKNKEWKSRRSEALSKKWQDPVWRAKMLQVLKGNVNAFREKRANNPDWDKHRMRGINQIKSPGARREHGPTPTGEDVLRATSK